MPKEPSRQRRKKVAKVDRPKQGSGSTVQMLSKIGGEDKMFNGGSPVLWNAVRDQVIRAFKGANVYRFIEYPEDAEEADIVETVFELQEPNYQESVDNAMQLAIDRVNAAHQVNVEAVEGNHNIDAAGTENEVLKLEKDTRDKRLAIENSRLSYETNFERASDRYIRERDRFDERLATLHKVFQQVFGAVVMRGIKDLLDQNRFREAWFKINTENQRAAAGQNNVSILLDELESVDFDAKTMSYSAVESDVLGLIEQIVAMGEPDYSDSTKLHKIIKALRRSPGGEFDEITTRIQDDNIEFETARNMLIRKAATISTNLTFDQIHNRLGTKSAVLNNAGMQGQRNGGKCPVCNKDGHDAANCWSKKVCAYCKKKGHIEDVCRVKKNDVKRNGKDPDNGGEIGNRFVTSNSKKDTKYCEDLFDCVVKEVNTHVCTDMTDHHVSREMESCLSNTALRSLQVKTVRLRILIDTGGSHHMLPRSLIVKNYRKSTGTVRLGDTSKRLTIKGVGDTAVKEITGVLDVQGLAIGILAVCQFDRIGFQSLFGNSHGTVYDTNGNVFLTSTLVVEGVYLLDSQYVEYLTTGCSPCLTEVTTGHSDACAEMNARVRCSDVKLSERVDTPSNGMTSADNGLNKARGDCPGTLRISEKHYSDPCASTVGTVTMSGRSNSGEISATTLKGATLSTGITTDEVALTDNKTISDHTPNPARELNPLEILHRQWGHMGADRIKSTLKDGAVKGCKYTYKDVQNLHMPECEHCLQGRMRAKPERGTTDHNWLPCGKIAMDYKGDFARKTLHKERGFMLMVDYATNWVWADLVKSKAEHTRVMQDFMIKIVKRYGHEWKVLQSDSESIFKSQRVRNWLRKKEIRLQLSTPYQHWENGQVEVYVRIVMDKTRTLMAVYNTPVRYWGYGVLYTCYTLNRTPNTNTGISAFEAMTGMKPDLSIAVPFYAPGVYHLTADERKGPWAPKARPCRMLGYADEYRQAYVILSLDSGKIIVRENCKFNMEDVQPDLEEIEVNRDADRDDIDEFEIMIEDEDSDAESSDSDSDVSGVEVEEPFNVENEEVIDYGGDNPYWHAMLEDLHVSEVDSFVCQYDNWRNTMLCAAGLVEPLPANPKTVSEALQGPHAEQWEAAIRKELDQFRTRTTFGPAEQKGRGMKTKLILIYKYDGDYNLVCKARLVVCGYSQKKGIDYFETFSPTTNTMTVLTLLCLAGFLDSQVCMFDVSAAFLEGRADTRMFAWLPADIDIEGLARRIEILGNWYGTKQAGKIWNDLFDKIVVAMGLERCIDNPCLYRWTCGVEYLYMTVHVDDGFMISTSMKLAREFMTEFSKHVRKVVMYEEVKLYLGMDITRSADRRTFYVSQQRYIGDCCKGFNKKYLTPMSTETNLRETKPNSSNESLLPITGKLRYIADRGRPDILQALGAVSTGGCNEPSDSHCGVAARIRHYLTTTNNLTLSLGGTDPIVLFGYSDAAYVKKGDGKSRLGGCLFLNKTSGAVSSISRNDSTVSHSSTEAEIKAIDMMCREIVRTRSLLEFLGCEQTEPTKLYVDNKSAMDLCKTLKTTHNTGHINIRIHYIRELINARVILLMFVPSELNVSDMLTKAIGNGPHKRHTTILLSGHEAVEDGTTLFLTVHDYPTQDFYYNNIDANDEAMDIVLADLD